MTQPVPQNRPPRGPQWSQGWGVQQWGQPQGGQQQGGQQGGSYRPQHGGPQFGAPRFGGGPQYGAPRFGGGPQYGGPQYGGPPQGRPPFGPMGPWPGGHRQPPAPRRGGGWGVVLVVVALVAAVGLPGYVWLNRTSNTTNPTISPVVRTTPALQTTPVETEPSTEPPTSEPPSSEPPTTPPTTQPTTSEPPVDTGVLPQRTWAALPGPHSNHPTWVTLQRNSIYGYDFPKLTCPDVPDGFSSTQQFRTFATNTLNCQHNGWATIFKAAGKALPKPKVLFISGAVQTPCGTSGAKVSFYCGSWDGSSYAIYVHSSLIEQSNTWWRLRGYETLSHEYAHHVQMMAGVLRANSNLVQAGNLTLTEGSRRLELQASCYSMRLLYITPSTKFSRADYQTVVEWSSVDQDEYHGSAKSNTYWWQRGLYMQKVGGCNTWTVGSSSVS
ncbi:neutral zinc metallopeptidase [Propionibacteriaceae bacterium G57]|uniref:neutral zinc metallopeptidase n=1 Tax=Aestuariimicrobium sp. G57 TaxID=3418485 RepID=UPI003DA74EB9